jgi:hypothetical protein
VKYHFNHRRLTGDENYEVGASNLRYEEEEEWPSGPWASSLPELRDWNKITPESSFDARSIKKQIEKILSENW